MIKEKECKCNFCIRNRMFDTIIKKYKTTKKYRKFLEDMNNDLIQTKYDLDYYKAILSGEWNNSVGILERALIKAKDIQRLRSKQ